MADEARREKALRELVAAAEAVVLELYDEYENGKSPEVDRFREALEEARHLGAVPW